MRLLSKNIRRLELFRSMGMFTQEQGITIVRAITANELIDAYKFVYDIKNGNDHKKVIINNFQALPETATFVIRKFSEIIGVISIVPYTHEFKLPSHNLFGIEELTNKKVVEVTNLAITKECSKINIFMELSKVILSYLLFKGYNYCFIVVNEAQSIFFESVFGFEDFGSDYENNIFCKLLDINNNEEKLYEIDDELGDNFLHDYFYKNNNYELLVIEWDKLANKAFLDINFLYELFVNYSDYIKDCNDGEIVDLKKHWDHKLLEGVLLRMDKK